MKKEKRLLFSVKGRDPKQCRWDYFTAPGKGGQKKNRCKSAARVTHLASGAVGQAVESRSQAKNRQIAFKRMGETPEFKRWLKFEAARQTGEVALIEQQVEREVKNMKVERKVNGRWEEWNESA